MVIPTSHTKVPSCVKDNSTVKLPSLCAFVCVFICVRCLDYVLDEIALNRNANVMVASHNEDTVKHTLRRYWFK